MFSLLFSLSGLVLSSVLFLNALAILSEDRFLKRIGWGYTPEKMMGSSAKDKIISLLHAVRLLMRVPLIFVNLVAILLMLLFG
ncbi:immediate early response 3-interacting protein 1 [Pelomyxa schiedti]|nr:immediate early response 3-interacting protein 1 [Pelomyxa schiedti]